MKNSVSYWMSQFPVKIDKNESIQTASEIMKKEKIHHLLVFDNGFLSGILSSDDLKLADSIRMRFKNADTSLIIIKVGDLMSRTPVTIDKDLGMFEAIELMRIKQFRSLPVKESGGVIVGILTQTDVLRFVLEGLRKDCEEAAAPKEASR